MDAHDFTSIFEKAIDIIWQIGFNRAWIRLNRGFA